MLRVQYDYGPAASEHSVIRRHIGQPDGQHFQQFLRILGVIGIATVDDRMGRLGADYGDQGLINGVPLFLMHGRKGRMLFFLGKAVGELTRMAE